MDFIKSLQVILGWLPATCSYEPSHKPKFDDILLWPLESASSTRCSVLTAPCPTDGDFRCGGKECALDQLLVLPFVCESKHILAPDLNSLCVYSPHSLWCVGSLKLTPSMLGTETKNCSKREWLSPDMSSWIRQHQPSNHSTNRLCRITDHHGSQGRGSSSFHP